MGQWVLGSASDAEWRRATSSVLPCAAEERRSASSSVSPCAAEERRRATSSVLPCADDERGRATLSGSPSKPPSWRDTLPENSSLRHFKLTELAMPEGVSRSELLLGLSAGSEPPDGRRCTSTEPSVATFAEDGVVTGVALPLGSPELSAEAVAPDTPAEKPAERRVPPRSPPPFPPPPLANLNSPPPFPPPLLPESVLAERAPSPPGIDVAHGPAPHLLSALGLLGPDIAHGPAPHLLSPEACAPVKSSTTQGGGALGSAGTSEIVEVAGPSKACRASKKSKREVAALQAQLAVIEADVAQSKAYLARLHGGMPKQ